ncbi:MAG: methionine gamma-lyase family protein, partial [Candidatus Melainabacteria bacterium]|nr:methionine gamma-lyase family protein [Candidatus Melainabacteria bacterium]
GRPYDTLGSVIGTSENDKGSLKSLGINYLEADIEPYLKVHDSLESFLEPLVSKPTAIAYIQKSCGYSFGRRALSCHDIGRVSNVVHRINPDCAVLVDNCYGEFVEPEEPCAVGADLVVGSLIKNPGGGLALTGGYIAGRTNLVNASLNRLTCPGIGGHMGLTYNQNRLMLQGLFQAPSIVSQALKGAHLFAYVFSQLGLSVSPGPFDSRADIIQAIQFGTPERLINFCRAIQKCSPVNAHVLPEPAAMPGYPQEIIMAGGTFIEGATIELSADGPLRSPFAAFVQGGLSYLHVKHALQEALELARSGKLAFLDG